MAGAPSFIREPGDQADASRFRFLRHQPSRPPAAKLRPGKPLLGRSNAYLPVFFRGQHPRRAANRSAMP